MTSHTMVGYTHTSTTNVEQDDNVLCGKIWREKAYCCSQYGQKFKLGFDPKAHIQDCEKKWRRIGYRDERV
jgi:hypothetical protein